MLSSGVCRLSFGRRSRADLRLHQGTRQRNKFWDPKSPGRNIVMSIEAILQQKGRNVVTIDPNTSIRSAAERLREMNIAALVVINAGSILGIVSERDIVRIVAEKGGDGLGLPITDCMTHDVIFAEPQETVDSLLSRMTDRRIRHLPVCREGKLIGIVSIGDLVKRKIDETVAEAETLKAYIAA